MFRQMFSKRRCVSIGMIHVAPLPGTPKYQGSMQKIIDEACKEAEIYKKSTIDAVMIENMHDIPYIQSPKLGPEIVASMTKVCSQVREILPSNIKCGVQVLTGGNKEAIAIAKASGLNFIRAEGFVFGHIADEGFIDSCAGDLLRYRRNIDANDILIFTDIKKKHSSHAITSDVSIEETAHAAEFFLSDAVIVTGTTTGKEADKNEIISVKKATKLPVLVGSGVTLENVDKYLNADGLIIGSHFKENGRWENPVSEIKVMKFMEKFDSLVN